jgi:hypothetical protein
MYLQSGDIILDRINERIEPTSSKFTSEQRARIGQLAVAEMDAEETTFGARLASIPIRQREAVARQASRAADNGTDIPTQVKIKDVNFKLHGNFFPDQAKALKAELGDAVHVTPRGQHNSVYFNPQAISES